MKLNRNFFAKICDENVNEICVKNSRSNTDSSVLILPRLIRFRTLYSIQVHSFGINSTESVFRFFSSHFRDRLFWWSECYVVGVQQRFTCGSRHIKIMLHYARHYCSTNKYCCFVVMCPENRLRFVNLGRKPTK